MPKHRFPYRPDVLNHPTTGKLRLPVPIEHPGPDKVKRLYTGTNRKPVQALKLVVDRDVAKPTSNSVVEALRTCASIKHSSPEYRKIDKPKYRWRPCMCCGNNFPSEGNHHRLCNYCRFKGD